jgi:hypothetical protein
MLRPLCNAEGFSMAKRELFLAASVAALLAAGGAEAQVTGAGLWADWKAFATGSGQSVTAASEGQSGDAYVVSNVTFTMQSPDGEGTFTTTIGELRFRDRGDGSVEVTMSPSYIMAITGTSDEGKPVLVELAFTQNGLVTIAKGVPGATTYDFTAGSIAVSTTKVQEAGADLPVRVSFVANGPTGSYALTGPAAGTVSLISALSAQSAALDVFADDAEAGSKLTLQASIQQFASTTKGTFGDMMSEALLSEALKKGFATDVAFTFGPLAYTMEIVEATGPTNVQGKTDSGSFALAIDQSKLSYTGGGKGVMATVRSSQLPFPEVVVQYAESLFDFRMPVSAGPDLQDFVFTTKLVDLSVSDAVWGLFDPGATLPRDPATLVIETNGKTKLLVDIMNEEAMDSLAGPPGEMHALNIPALQVKIAGAELTGSGALTFDNSDLVTFEGMPAPTGKIDLSLTGGNGLLDKLIALGYVPEDQAMGVRMMMGMFARPGATPDSLTSTLEFKDKGFFANGMQLQ